MKLYVVKLGKHRSRQSLKFTWQLKMEISENSIKEIFLITSSVQITANSYKNGSLKLDS